jgi:hypothetical protein
MNCLVQRSSARPPTRYSTLPWLPAALAAHVSLGLRGLPTPSGSVRKAPCTVVRRVEGSEARVPREAGTSTTGEARLSWGRPCPLTDVSDQGF